MAYIPPHKRNSSGPVSPVLTPDKLGPLFSRNVIVGSSKFNRKRAAFKIMYADRAISRWWAVGYDETRFLSSVNLVPVSVETSDNRIGERLIVLRNSGLDNGNEVKWDLPKSPWVYMAENVFGDLLESFENVKREMMSSEAEEEKDMKHTLVARVGKALLHRPPSVTMESFGENWTTEMLKSWNRRFDTKVPASYIEKIVHEVVSNTGVTFESEKDTYVVKLADSTNPDLILSCKCSVKAGQLELYKVELNQVRNMVVDMSIPDKNLDLRLILAMKKILTSQTDDEMQNIRDLVDSAITDPGVKGGLRWPLEKKSSGKYYVYGVWHITSKTYFNQSLRFKVRHADRFDFETSSGEAFWGISLWLKKLESELKEEKVDVSLVSETLEENLKFIWEHFLTCESFLK